MLKIRPSGSNGATATDAGLLKASNHSDAKMLDCELTVSEGAFARRKFWQNFTVAGGKLDEKHMKMPRQALHANKLEITHPLSEEPKIFVSPLPPDMDFYLQSHKPLGEKR